MKRTLLLLAATLLASLALSAQTYLEEPTRVPDSGPYITAYATLDGAWMRSYTYRYDTTRHIALWVAYPLNSGLIGTGSRGDGWNPDPALDESVQPSLFRGFRYGSGYDRGHQIPSADRLEPYANAQTFLFTNATPQLHDFNGGIWAELEKVVRTWAKRSDTLYVVTGVLPGKKTIADNDGRPVNIPSAYYKAVLRRNTLRSGTVQWTACAVLLPHEVVTVGTWQENLQYFKDHSLSLSELERCTGETYYPLLGSILPHDEYQSVKTTHPSDNRWWWR